MKYKTYNKQIEHDGYLFIQDGNEPRWVPVYNRKINIYEGIIIGIGAVCSVVLVLYAVYLLWLNIALPKSCAMEGKLFEACLFEQIQFMKGLFKW